jgi:hypothetical protein
MPRQTDAPRQADIVSDNTLKRFNITREELEELGKQVSRYQTIMRYSRAHDGENPVPLKWKKKEPYDCKACGKVVSNKTNHCSGKRHKDNEARMMLEAQAQAP